MYPHIKRAADPHFFKNSSTYVVLVVGPSQKYGLETPCSVDHISIFIRRSQLFHQEEMMRNTIMRWVPPAVLMLLSFGEQLDAADPRWNKIWTYAPDHHIIIIHHHQYHLFRVFCSLTSLRLRSHSTLFARNVCVDACRYPYQPIPTPPALQCVVGVSHATTHDAVN